MLVIAAIVIVVALVVLRIMTDEYNITGII